VGEGEQDAAEDPRGRLRAGHRADLLQERSSAGETAGAEAGVDAPAEVRKPRWEILLELERPPEQAQAAVVLRALDEERARAGEDRRGRLRVGIVHGREQAQRRFVVLERLVGSDGEGARASAARRRRRFPERIAEPSRERAKTGEGLELEHVLALRAERG